MLKVLFLCTGNSCRSQMAEGWARHFHADSMTVWSAGTDRHGLNPRAVQVMAEAGVDISSHESKTVSDLPDIEFDYVITVCSDADKNCPVFPGPAKKIHRGFDDPPRLARDAADEEEILSHYRRVRDEIRDFVKTVPAWLAANQEQQSK